MNHRNPQRPWLRASICAAWFVVAAGGAIFGDEIAAPPSGAGHMDQMGSHMHAGPHMRLSPARAPTEADRKRALDLLAAMRTAFARYQDPKAAEADGYQPFLPTVPQEVYHFVHYGVTAAEYVPGARFDAAKPGSFLYAPAGAFGGGYRLVGAMYSAPERATEAELDTRIPLSIARWHAHVDICLPKGMTLDDVTRGDIGNDDRPGDGKLDSHGPHAGLMRLMNKQYGFMADGRFGFEGRISDRAECEAAEGSFLPQAYGWMVHVYPFAGDDLEVAFGMDVP